MDWLKIFIMLAAWTFGASALCFWLGLVGRGFVAQIRPKVWSEFVIASRKLTIWQSGVMLMVACFGAGILYFVATVVVPEQLERLNQWEKTQCSTLAEAEKFNTYTLAVGNR